MSRYIKVEDMRAIFCQSNSLTQAWNGFDMLPRFDIVRCKECKWAKANATYQWCGRLDSTARIIADDFCSYGVRLE